MLTAKRQRILASGFQILLSLCLLGCGSYISKDAHQRLVDEEHPVSVTVFPVNVVLGNRLESDPVLAMELSRFLVAGNLAQAFPTDVPATLPVVWGHNQAKMARNSALAFASVVQEMELETPYALLVELLCNSDESRVLGVHYYLVESGGEPASGALRNSHWNEFKQIQPCNRKDGLEVAKLVLVAGW